MERYICIHGHFYQPPRENAWLEYVELQDSAYPYHDWNERITAECYAPNGASRILDGEKYITQIVNNYARMSFNFGPTLLAWMKSNASDIYQMIIEADKESQQRFSGHSSALAQAYNHIIMPLASGRDKYTQVLWGIRDFEHHFGRKPEGMWLPETAVDIETLDILSQLGVKFTVLAPHQAARVRQIGTDAWSDVSGGKIDPTMAYEISLPSGRKLSLFFYDGPTARAVAFEGLLAAGENLVNRLIGAFSDKRTWPQLVHIATDGETYGHHHRFGDMALAFAINHIEKNNLAKITNYGEYLEKHPPAYEVEIIENTSWSCPHGVERWRSDCGCNTGVDKKWNQAWRTPLRQAFDWLRDTIAPQYEEKTRQFLKDPWAARDDYITVILDRAPENVEKFLNQHAVRELNEAEKVTVLKLMELQRHAMLMYTSCGWFFDDLSGIETVQVIQYAGRVVQLAQEIFGDNTESSFLEILASAKSNIPEHGDGRAIYEKFVKPAMIDLNKVTAHFAVSSLFEEYAEETKIFCYPVNIEDYQPFVAGKPKFAVGRVRVTSEITWESTLQSFGVLHFGDHNVNAGIRDYQGEETYQAMLQETTQAFSDADFPEVIRLLGKHFGTSTYSLKSLFWDEQRKVLGLILEATLAEIEAAYRQLYEHHYPLMRFLGSPLPKAFSATAEFIINSDLRKTLSNEVIDVERIKSLIEEARVWNVTLDNEGLSYLLQQSLEKMMTYFAASPDDYDILENLADAVTMTKTLPFAVDLWKVQNIYYEMLHNTYPDFQKRAQQGDKAVEEWLTQFASLGQELSIRGT